MTGLDTANHSYTFLLRARNRVYVSDQIGPVTAQAPVIPTVTSIAISSVPGDDGTYQYGDSIQVLVGFSEDVTVTGTPHVELQFDGSATDTGRRLAEYTDGVGAWLGFLYIVRELDIDNDGIAIPENGLKLNGGAIQGADGRDADLSHDAVAANGNHQVDAVVPTIVSIGITSDPGADGFYVAGDAIEVAVTFSEEVTVSASPDGELGLPELELDLGGEPGTSELIRGTGARLVFAYVVQEGDEALNGVALGANKLRAGDATSIQGENGADADLSHDAVSRPPRP